jgi:phosphoadenosine phosphosulfate reductase
MLEQLQFGSDGVIRSPVETAIKRLQSFEPPEGYYVAFSGGKDSQCAYHLCKMAGVKFDAHYAVTSVDPPELVRFIKEYYPDVQFERQYDKNGKPITMWSLIAEHTLPPTRKVRYCCSALKETGGQGRVVVTGVRWAESANRKNTHDVVDIRGKRAKKKADAIGAEYKQNKHGDVIMNDDNDESRRMVEQCYRTRKTMVNPIVDWTDEDVWGFLNKWGIAHCSLYDEGFTRLGCICCPLSGSVNMERDFERWPKYKELYIRAFQRMIDNHPGEIRILDPNANTKFKLEVPENAGVGGYDGSTTGWNGVERAYFRDTAEAYRWYIYGWHK